MLYWSHGENVFLHCAGKFRTRFSFFFCSALVVAALVVADPVVAALVVAAPVVAGPVVAAPVVAVVASAVELLFGFIIYKNIFTLYAHALVS